MWDNADFQTYWYGASNNASLLNNDSKTTLFKAHSHFLPFELGKLVKHWKKKTRKSIN